jgi:hypothetical protein
MNKKILILLAIFALIVSMLFTGCQEESGLTIEERIREFVSDLNGPVPRNSIREHFHPSSAHRNISEQTLAIAFPSNRNYFVISILGSGSSRTVRIGSATPESWTFAMREDGKNGWYISSFY